MGSIGLVRARHGAALVGLALAGCIIREPPPYYGGQRPGTQPGYGQPGAPQSGYGGQQPGAGDGEQPGYGDAEEPQEAPAEEGDQAGFGDQQPGSFTLSCQFPDGWVAVIPADLYQPGDDYLMQALLGFAVEPEFWQQQQQYAQLAPYAAQRCGAQPIEIQRYAGEYVILVGWIGRGDYRQNGHVEAATLQAGQALARSFRNTDLTNDWPCISCPFLAVRRGGRFVDVGNVLVDRYSARLAGTDTVKTTAEVERGRIRILVSEREPEVSFVDAVELRIAGRPLAAAALPSALRAGDGATLQLVRGQQVELAFDAAGLPDGPVAVEVRVTGWYQPVSSSR